MEPERGANVRLDGSDLPFPAPCWGNVHLQGDIIHHVHRDEEHPRYAHEYEENPREQKEEEGPEL